jgi:two-component system chemotaxis response regulator CheY
MHAENGMDALQKIYILKENRNDIGLCIVDINMPMMDGITFIKEFRKDDRFTPILVISTESSMDKVSEGMSAGASGWINKPFDIAELNSTLQKFFR